MKNLIALFCLIFLVSLAAGAQPRSLDTLQSKFRAAREAGIQEKLYLHTDRGFYLTGESMYFKIYQLDASLHLPLNVSKVAYVEILDVANQSVAQAKIKLSENGGDGSLFIPATLSSGNYLVRAYTQWMKNYPAEYYFHKQITIVNPFLKPETTPAKKQPQVRVEFFPEGGNLVAGVRSKVAFKILSTAPDEQYTGYLVAEGDTLVSFRPLKFNLGHFYFTPENGTNYSCIVTDSRNVTSSHPLPRVFDKGFVMQLSDSLEKAVRVTVSEAGNPVPGSSVYLFVHSRQIVIHAEARTTGSPSIEFFIDRDKIPDGISHFTVFNDKLQPVCERLYFSKPKHTLRLNASTDQASYTTRRKVSLQMATSVEGNPVDANLSVAVYRLDSLGSTDNSDILSYLLLSSDLRGDIENPAFYFSDDQNVREAADNLMLTHGWRRFKWEEILQGDKKFAFVPEVRTHIVSGKVSRSDGQPAPNILTYLASPAKLVGLNGSRSDQNGEVTFEIQDFWGSRKLVLQPFTNNDSTYALSITDPFSKSFSAFTVSPFSISSAVRKNLKSRSLAMQVHDIHFRDVSEKNVMAARADSSAFYGVGDQVFFLDNYTRFPVMEEVMREYVPGVLVRKRRDGFHFLIIDATKKGVLDGDPLVLLDGVPILDLDRFMKFDPLRIKKLEVVMRNYYVGPLRVPGIVSFFTYSGDLAGYEIKSPAVVMDYQGMQVSREYYTPTYENAKARNDRMPDQRTLLTWAPTVSVANDGKQTLEFYTSDIPGHYQVVIEGLTNTGKAGSTAATFEVKRQDF